MNTVSIASELKDPGNTTIKMHGVNIPAPFEWLEDWNSQKAIAWRDAQKKLVSQTFDGNKTVEHEISRIQGLDHYVPTVAPIVRNNRIFWFDRPHNSEAERLIFIDEQDNASKVIFDPNFEADNARLDPALTFVSSSGRYIAYSVFTGGADTGHVEIYDIESGKMLPDFLPPAVHPFLAWGPNEDGFFYSINSFSLSEKYNQPGIYWHQLGTPLESDELVFTLDDSSFHTVLPFVSDDGAHLFLKEINFVTQAARIFTKVINSSATPYLLFDALGGYASVVGTRNKQVIIETSRNAQNGQIIALDLSVPSDTDWQVLAPEQKWALVHSVHAVKASNVIISGNNLVATYLKDAAHVVLVYSAHGNKEEIPFPIPSSVIGITKNTKDLLEFHTSCFSRPYIKYQFDLACKPLELHPENQLKDDLPPLDVEQVWFTSSGGVKVPMFILKPKGKVMEQPLPCLMYGYGGWASSITPSYRFDVLSWIAKGGIYVVVNLRGGGEFGKDWHDAGRLLKKQNVFDDFCNAAKYLHVHKYTKPEQTAIRGVSNGGLLTAACYVRKPELFSAVISRVPLVDILRLSETPVGQAIADELGDPSKDKAVFEYMCEYAPLTNLHDGRAYPALFVISAANDDRARPAQAAKFLANAQRFASSDKLVLFRYVEGEGHAFWHRTREVQVWAEELYFIQRSIGMVHEN